MQRTNGPSAERTGLTGCWTDGSVGKAPYKERVDSRHWDLLVNSPGQAKKSQLNVPIRTQRSGALVLPDVYAASFFQNFPSQSGLWTSQTQNKLFTRRRSW